MNRGRDRPEMDPAMVPSPLLQEIYQPIVLTKFSMILSPYSVLLTSG